jgi:hypothetical protein
MTAGIHNVIKKHIEAEYYSPINVVTAKMSYTDFSSAGSLKFDGMMRNMSNKMIDLLIKGSMPTVNPVIDKIFEYDEKDGKKGLYLYIKDCAEIERNQVDNTKDAVKILIPIDILLINCLPFIDQDEIVIESASIQTPLFRREIKE